MNNTNSDNNIKISTEFIKLDQFLKFAGVCQTGGQAKDLILDGLCQVNGVVATERGKKLYPGDNITLEDQTWYITK